MKRQYFRHPRRLTIAYVLAATLAASVALAQGPGGPPPPFGGPPPGPPPPVSAANIPLPFLDSQLSLTSGQESRMKQIQADARAKRDTLRPMPDSRLPDGPPSRAEMDAMRAKADAIDSTATSQIRAALTASQKQALPGIVAQAEALRADGIPLQIYDDLNLTASQKDKLTAIGQAAAKADKLATDKAKQTGDFQSLRATVHDSRQTTHAKVDAVLSDSQRQTLETFQQDHPRPGPDGGPGMGGPPPPGNRPPPPDGDALPQPGF